MTTSPPPSPRPGLLAELMSNTLDEDYQAVAARRGSDSPPSRVATIGLVVVLAVFGVLIGVSLLKTERDAPQAAAERVELVEQIHSGQDRLSALHYDITRLEAEVTDLQELLAANISGDTQLAGRLTALGVDAGTLAVTGPGVRITVDDAADPDAGPGRVIVDSDLQQLVNGLWEAGAEAISVDGHRLTSLTAIRFAGQAITVDYRSLTPPYVVVATGNPDTLPAMWAETAGGQYWQVLTANKGIQLEISSEDELTVPADPHDSLLHARGGTGS